jgi:hypothetical protein
MTENIEAVLGNGFRWEIPAAFIAGTSPVGKNEETGLFYFIVWKQGGGGWAVSEFETEEAATAEADRILAEHSRIFSR